MIMKRYFNIEGSCHPKEHYMFGKKKSNVSKIQFNQDTQQAIIRCSVCTGEQVAGFKDKKTGHFTEVMLIRNERDLQKFKQTYGLTIVTKEY